MSAGIPAVYVSSTLEDLVRHRAAVLGQIATMNFRPVAMEYAAAEERPPVESCLAAVKSCDVYVGIFAHRYGFIPPDHTQSITELEYRAAGEAGIERLIFLVDEQSPWADEGDGIRIRNLRDELRLAKTVQFFTTPEDLAGKVAAALHRWATSGRHSTALRLYLEDCIAKEGELDRKFVFLSGTGEHLVLPPTAYPVELVPRAFRVVRTRRQPEKETEIVPSIAEVLKRYPQVVILGDPGSGKSTILRYLHLVNAQQALEGSALVPLAINLAEWPESIPDLRSLLVHERDIKGCPSIPASNLLLLLDGLNEVRERDYEARVDSIQRWLEENPAARVVVAARQQQYLQNKQLSTATVTIHPLSDEQVETFVEKYLGAADASRLLAGIGWDRRNKTNRRDLAHLAENPFQLALLCYVYAESGQSLPSTRGELLRLLAQTTYQREVDLGTNRGLTYEEMQAGFGELALSAVQTRSATAIDGVWAARRVPRGIDFEKLRDLGVNTRLLRLSKNDHYIQFSHQLILEYFAAERLSQQLSRLPGMVRKIRFQHGQRRAQATDEVFHTLAEIHPDFGACLDAIAGSDAFLAIDALAQSERAEEVGYEQRTALAKQLLDAHAQNGEIRNAIIDRLQTLGDPAVVALRDLLESGTKPERRLAIQALTSIGSLDTIEVLIGSLKDSDRWVRREAHEALLAIAEHDPELAAEYARERLLEDTPETGELRTLLLTPPLHNEEVPEPAVRLPIAERIDPPPSDDESELGEDLPAVRKRRSRSAVRRHKMRLKPSRLLKRSLLPPPAVRGPGETDLQRLLRYVEDPVLRKQLASTVVPQLIAALDNGSQYVRRVVPPALAKTGDRRAVEPLVRLACDANSAIALAAAKALFTVFAGALTPPLLDSLRASPNPTVQALAARVFIELKSHPADAFEAIREEVFSRLAQQGISETEMRRGMMSSNREVRRTGLTALFSVDAVKGIDACIAIAKTGDPPDREFALGRIVKLIRQMDSHVKSLEQTKTLVPLRQFAVAHAQLIERRGELDAIVRGILNDPILMQSLNLQRQCMSALRRLSELP